MLSKALCSEILARAMSSGADFAELYQELTHNNVIQLISGKIEKIGDNVLSGVGVRAFVGTKTVYAYTCDLSREGLLRCASGVADTVAQSKNDVSIRLTERIFPNINPVRRLPGDVDVKERISVLKEACFAAKDYDSRISQVAGNLISVDHNILVANSEGLYSADRNVRTRLAISAIASDGSENQSGYNGPGRSMGMEMFETISPAETGIEASRQAIVNLEAEYCPAGQMTVAIANGFGGVIFHEACGHSLEATSVGIGASQMCGKLGQKIAGDKVTAIDDGTIPGAWGSINMDDEGHPAQKNILIENGVLKSYMVDRLGSRRMGLPCTGSGRRQGYTFEPTSRMTNTYIANGPDKNEDIIASIEYGLYAAHMGGGSVNPVTGAFNFAVSEGYIVRNGKICEPVRGASLIGTGSRILMDIDMVGQDLDLGQGMCGSSSGSIPTNVGQPLIRVSNITVGGRNQ